MSLRLNHRNARVVDIVRADGAVFGYVHRAVSGEWSAWTAAMPFPPPHGFATAEEAVRFILQITNPHLNFSDHLRSVVETKASRHV